jgi:hypothetical protein
VRAAVSSVTNEMKRGPLGSCNLTGNGMPICRAKVWIKGNDMIVGLRLGVFVLHCLARNLGCTIRQLFFFLVEEGISRTNDQLGRKNE